MERALLGSRLAMSRLRTMLRAHCDDVQLLRAESRANVRSENSMTPELAKLVAELREAALFNAWQNPDIAKQTLQAQAAAAIESLQRERDEAEAGRVSMGETYAELCVMLVRAGYTSFGKASDALALLITDRDDAKTDYHQQHKKHIDELERRVAAEQALSAERQARETAERLHDEEIAKRIAAVQARERAEADAELLRGLRELCGYFQDGGERTVKLFQDDACRDYHIEVDKRHWCADSWSGVIMEAIAALTPEASHDR